MRFDVDALLDELADRIAARLAVRSTAEVGPRFLDARAARDLMSIDVRTFRRVVASGELPSRLLGRKRVVAERDLVAWIEAQRGPKHARKSAQSAANDVDESELDEDRADLARMLAKRGSR